jgi:hypothetical protein
LITELIIGTSETHGGLTGDSMVTSELRERPGSVMDYVA